MKISLENIGSDEILHLAFSHGDGEKKNKDYLLWAKNLD